MNEKITFAEIGGIIILLLFAIAGLYCLITDPNQKIMELEKEVERLDEIRTGIKKDYYIVGYKDCELDKTQQYPISSQDVWQRNVVHINEIMN